MKLQTPYTRFLIHFFLNSRRTKRTKEKKGEKITFIYTINQLQILCTFCKWINQDVVCWRCELCTFPNSTALFKSFSRNLHRKREPRAGERERERELLRSLAAIFSVCTRSIWIFFLRYLKLSFWCILIVCCSKVYLFSLFLFA